MVFIILFALLFAGVTIAGFVFGGIKLYSAAEVDTSEYSGYSKVDENVLAKRRNKKAALKRSGIVGMIIGVIGVLGFITVPWNFHQVESGEVAVVRHMGKIEGVRESGVHFDFWVTNSYQIYDTKVRAVQSETMAYSKDKQTMTIQMNVQYKIDVAHVEQIALTYGSLEALESRINSVVIERTKSTLSGYDADAIISDRAAVSASVAEMVENAIGEQYYIDVTNIALTNIDFSDAYEQSVEQSMIAKQEVERAKAEAEKLLVEAENKVKIAQAEANAKKATAEGEAEAIKIQAQADAEALALIEAAWEGIDPAVREIMLREMGIEKWDGKLPETMVGSDFIEQLLGALGSSVNP